MISKRKTVSDWLFSPCVKLRQFYSFLELYQQFTHDTCDNSISISKKAFTRILTNISTDNKRLKIVHVKRREFKYIIQLFSKKSYETSKRLQ